MRDYAGGLGASAGDGGCAQVDHFARQLGVPVDNELACSGHHVSAQLLAALTQAYQEAAAVTV
jgi:hypothetical protein